MVAGRRAHRVGRTFAAGRIGRIIVMAPFRSIAAEVINSHWIGLERTGRRARSETVVVTLDHYGQDVTG